MNDEKVPKGAPIPIRFDEREDKALRDLKRQLGLGASEIVRRAVKVLIAECKRRKDTRWILDEFGPPPEFMTELTAASDGGDGVRLLERADSVAPQSRQEKVSRRNRA